MNKAYILRNTKTKKLYLAVQAGAGTLYYPIDKKDIDINRTPEKNMSVSDEFELEVE